MRKKRWGVVETPEFAAGKDAANDEAREHWRLWMTRAAEILQHAPSIEDAMDELGLGTVPACFAEELRQPYPVTLAIGPSTIVEMRIDSEGSRLILTGWLHMD